MSDGPTDCAKAHKAKEFKNFKFDSSGNLQKPPENVTFCKQDIEQRVLLNSLDIMQGALWMLKREYYRHQKDCLNILIDIRKLEAMNVTLPPSLRLDLWFEIPNEDPRTGRGVK